MARWRVCLANFSFFVFSCLFFGQSYSATQNQTSPSENTVNVGLVVFPPYTSRDGDNECVGPYIDALQKLFVSSEFTLNIICAPAARVYRMIGSGEVDFTINVKSTRGLVGNVEFFPKPFSALTLALYEYKNATEKSISAIRAFDYNGYRNKLNKDGYRFIDVPTAEDAVELFIRKRSQHLISYQTPYNYYLMANGIEPDSNIKITELQSIPTYMAISQLSPFREALLNWLITIDSEQFNSLLETAQHL